MWQVATTRPPPAAAARDVVRPAHTGLLTNRDGFRQRISTLHTGRKFRILISVSVTHPTHAQIAARAYELYVQHGRKEGYDRDDWLQAEYELTQLPVAQIAELDAPKAKDKQHRSLVDVVRSAITL